jgi:REP element-mobilizing transposase RayT
MKRNLLGEIALNQWLQLPNRFTKIVLHAFVIMPNHMHGIIEIINENHTHTGKGKAVDNSVLDGNGCLPLDNISSTGRGKAVDDSVFDGNQCLLSTALPLRHINSNSGPKTNDLHGTSPGSIPAIVQNYKSVTTYKINTLLRSPGQSIWQRNYYEHIVRDEEDFSRIEKYIHFNPENWENDDMFSQ